jgi:hypothetical protein
MGIILAKNGRISLCGCYIISYISMDRVSHLFASNIISKRWNEAYEIGDDLINSLNAKNCIINRGKPDALIAWFLIELYCKVSDNEVNKKRAFYPKDFIIFEEILKKWDSNDLREVDKFVYLLCEYHLYTSAEDEEDALKKLEIPSLLLFPYEVIAWLNIREKEGIQNPQEYSHPLMNEPIAQSLLKIKESLIAPQNIPFEEDFMKFIYEHCEKYETKEKELKKEVKSISIPDGLVPKTGKYRATLPNEHPQAKQLESDPHSYARFKKDDTFTYEGLEDYELSHITWRFIGD